MKEEEINFLGGSCKCGEDSELVRVGVSAKMEIVIVWKCEECGRTMTARWTGKEIVELARLLANNKPEKKKVTKEDIQNARKITEEDIEYLKKMHIDFDPEDDTPIN